MFDHTQRPANFVELKALAPSILQDLRYSTNNNFTGTVVTGYQANNAWLTHQAATALAQVQTAIQPWGLSLYIFDAYRPKRAVQHFIDWSYQPEDPTLQQRFYPNMTKRQLFEQGYIATRSSHMRGSTVDLTLATHTEHGWQELDMGTEFDVFGLSAAPDYPELTLTQRNNRLLLRSIMLQHGFHGFELEWWHFTLNNEPYPEHYFDFIVE
ncbi:M15 family metallopeptidase [Thiofilum flexile]|uniref:M15 family metallopeptidase n=1 Tax=Thiofilum flexile TaxID=125627 RepID=UPI0003699FC4|nr:M15 family metallopeptidase [Thiofilum flexile]